MNEKTKQATAPQLGKIARAQQRLDEIAKQQRALLDKSAELMRQQREARADLTRADSAAAIASTTAAANEVTRQISKLDKEREKVHREIEQLHGQKQKVSQTVDSLAIWIDNYTPQLPEVEKVIEATRKVTRWPNQLELEKASRFFVSMRAVILEEQRRYELLRQQLTEF